MSESNLGPQRFSFAKPFSVEQPKPKRGSLPRDITAMAVFCSKCGALLKRDLVSCVSTDGRPEPVQFIMPFFFPCECEDKK